VKDHRLSLISSRRMAIRAAKFIGRETFRKIHESRLLHRRAWEILLLCFRFPRRWLPLVERIAHRAFAEAWRRKHGSATPLFPLDEEVIYKACEHFFRQNPRR